MWNENFTGLVQQQLCTTQAKHRELRNIGMETTQNREQRKKL